MYKGLVQGSRLLTSFNAISNRRTFSVLNQKKTLSAKIPTFTRPALFVTARTPKRLQSTGKRSSFKKLRNIFWMKTSDEQYR